MPGGRSVKAGDQQFEPAEAIGRQPLRGTLIHLHSLKALQPGA
jgi:hypothetical protein